MLLPLLCILTVCSAATPQPVPRVSGSGAATEWSAVAIGYDSDTHLPSSASRGLIEVTGAGADIGGEHDEFFYLFTSLPENGSLSVRLWEFVHVDEWSKAGLMVREGLDPDAPNVLLYVSGEHGALLQGRTEPGAATSSSGQVEELGAGTWLRLGRWGNEVVGEYSVDGFDWNQLGRYNLELSGDAYIGLAVTSHAAAKEATAGFTDLRLALGDIGSPPARDDGLAPGGKTATEPSGASSSPNMSWVCGPEPLTPQYQPTLYVSTDGNDRSDGRSEASALLTLQRAADLAQAGDVVWVRGGVYSADVSFQGTGNDEAPIVFESYPGECAILDGSGLESYQHVRFEGARFYVFRNFEVRNSAGQGIRLVKSHDNVVSNVRSHHNGLSGIQNVDSSRNQFSYFIVHDNSDGREGNADGIGISSGRGNRIDHCAAFRNSDDGIDAWRSHGTTIEYCISYENGFQGGDGNGFKAGGGLNNGNAVLRHNVAFGNKTQGFNYNSGRGITFVNNTSYGNGYSGFIAAYAELRNNIAYGNTRSDWFDDGNNEEVTNSWNLGLEDSPFASTDPNAADFLALAEDSRAIGAATGEASGDLGALPFGETLASFLGIDVSALNEY